MQQNLFDMHHVAEVNADIDNNDDQFDEDLTGKQVRKLMELRKQTQQKHLKDSGKQVLKGEIESGITGLQRNNLLPHFIMCLVGKPGSGKSTLMKKLIEDPQFYKDKFDDILVISPSLSKLELNILDSNTHQDFDFDWIYDAIFRINQRQLRHVQKTYMEQDQDQQYAKRRQKLINKTQGVGTFQNVYNQSLYPNVMQQTPQYGNPGLGINQYVSVLNRIYKDRAPQELSNISTMVQIKTSQRQLMHSQVGYLQPIQAAKTSRHDTDNYESKKHRNLRQKKKIDLIQKFSDETHKLFKQHAGSKEQMRKSHVNVLLLLDDVIGEINREMHSYQLSKLFLNRRHLIANGTISIIVSTQKYTMIPARIRSNSNWMILFRLNPVDFEIARTDATSFQKHTWEQILKHIFGQQIVEEKSKKLKIQEVDPDQNNQDENDYNYVSIHINGNKNKIFKNQDQLKIQ